MKQQLLKISLALARKMKLLIKPGNNTKLREFYLKYQNGNHHQHDTDAGLDLMMPYTTKICVGTQSKLDLGIQCYSVDKKPYMLMPRSSLSKKNIILVNSIGLIDQDYIGNIKAPVYNLIKKNNIGDLITMFILMSCTTLWLAYLSFISTIIYVIFFHYMANWSSNFKTSMSETMYETLEEGQCYFQLVSFDGLRIEVEVVNEFPNETTRGAGGFGSTTDTHNKDNPISLSTISQLDNSIMISSPETETSTKKDN